MNFVNQILSSRIKEPLKHTMYTSIQSGKGSIKTRLTSALIVCTWETNPHALGAHYPCFISCCP